MSETRINFGGLDWHTSLSFQELDDMLFIAGREQFMTVPLLLDGKPHSTIRIRAGQVKYYFEILDSHPQQA